MIFDLHNDLFTSGLSECEINRTVRTSRDKVIYAFWTTELSAPLPTITAKIAKYRDLGTLFAIEDAGFITEQDIVAVCELPLSYVGLTHNYDNALSGGAFGGGQLTKLGEKIVRALNAAGIPIDTAHINARSFYRVADMAERIINSHCGLYSIVGHPRNLTDEQIKLILRKGGVIGITAVSDFIGGDSISDYVRTLDSFVQSYGADSVCVGTDFHGTKPLKGLSSYEDFDEVIRRLSLLGYTDCDIKKILYENANGYFNRRSYNEP